MRYRNEIEFKRRIADILRAEDLCFSTEYLVCGGKRDDSRFPYDPKMNLFADFYLGGAEGAIIECKPRPSAAHIASGLGQCLLYRHNTRVKHFILCMPEHYRFEWGFQYWDYERLCKSLGIRFATEENVIGVLKDLAGSLDVFERESQHRAWLQEMRAAG